MTSTHFKQSRLRKRVYEESLCVCNCILYLLNCGAKQSGLTELTTREGAHWWFYEI